MQTTRLIVASYDTGLRAICYKLQSEVLTAFFLPPHGRPSARCRSFYLPELLEPP